MVFLISNLDSVPLSSINKHSPARVCSFGTDLTPLLVPSATRVLWFLFYHGALVHGGLQSKYAAIWWGVFPFMISVNQKTQQMNNSAWIVTCMVGKMEVGSKFIV